MSEQAQNEWQTKGGKERSGRLPCAPAWEDRLTGEQEQSDEDSGDGVKSYRRQGRFQQSLFRGYR